MSQTIPDRCREIKLKFRSMDKLVKQYGGTPEGDLFVQGFINSGSIDNLPGSPQPPAPPTP